LKLGKEKSLRVRFGNIKQFSLSGRPGLGEFWVMRRTFSPDDSFHLPALENDDVFFVVITKQYRLSITVVFYLTDCAFGEIGSMATITLVRRRKSLEGI
jgi:hypothetical protein